ncbi:hypothetical protein D3C75_451900 [compost metagenome]
MTREQNVPLCAGCFVAGKRYRPNFAASGNNSLTHHCIISMAQPKPPLMSAGIRRLAKSWRGFQAAACRLAGRYGIPDYAFWTQRCAPYLRGSPAICISPESSWRRVIYRARISPPAALWPIPLRQANVCIAQVMSRVGWMTGLWNIWVAVTIS